MDRSLTQKHTAKTHIQSNGTEFEREANALPLIDSDAGFKPTRVKVKGNTCQHSQNIQLETWRIQTSVH